MANFAKLYYLTTMLLLGIAFVFLLILIGTDIYYEHIKECRIFIISTILSGGINTLLGTYMIIYFLIKSCFEILGEGQSYVLLGGWWQFLATIIYLGVNVWNTYNCFMSISEPDDCDNGFKKDHKYFWIFSIVLSANFTFNVFVVVCHCIYKTICCKSNKKYQIMEEENIINNK
jgi:hypothetical protein